MKEQEHSHPVLRRQFVEKEPEVKSVEEKPVLQPSPSPSPLPPEPPPVVSTPVTPPTREIQYADPSTLQRVQASAAGIEDEFEKSILFVGAEEYDAATITILQGLNRLGFTIYTIGKPNVNSWFCNTVIEKTSGLKFDFVLSNVGWGVRWSHYTRYKLDRFPKVLINAHGNSPEWSAELDAIRTSVSHEPPSKDIISQEIQPHQWVGDYSKYTPDVTFGWRTLPCGICDSYIDMATDRATHERPNDEVTYAAVMEARGSAYIPSNVANYVAQDGSPGNHRWHEWIDYRGQYDLLNKSKMLICPVPYPLYAPTPWRALACGCLVIAQEPSWDVSDYPVTSVFPFGVCATDEEIDDKRHYLLTHPSILDRMRVQSAELAREYFTSVPLARRFLLHVEETIQ